jgi:hypothetical protein
MNFPVSDPEAPIRAAAFRAGDPGLAQSLAQFAETGAKRNFCVDLPAGKVSVEI